MTAVTRRAFNHNALPGVLGIGALIGFFVAMELLIRVGLINRYIVPLPTQKRITAVISEVMFESKIALKAFS